MQDLKEKTLSTELKYTGHIVKVRCDNVILSDGKEHFREVVEHPGGVVIIPVMDDNKIIFVKQWRYPVGCELTELPAGKLEKGEEHFVTAQRELEEETGYKANNWEYLGFIYTTPGFCNEKLHFYKATGLVKTETNPDYGEIIESVIMDKESVKNMIKIGKIVDAKTIVGVNYL